MLMDWEGQSGRDGSCIFIPPLRTEAAGDDETQESRLTVIKNEESILGAAKSERDAEERKRLHRARLQGNSLKLASVKEQKSAVASGIAPTRRGAQLSCPLK